MLAPDRDRDLNSDSGISGTLAKRAWMSRKVPNKATPIASVMRVRADPHGWVSVLTIP